MNTPRPEIHDALHQSVTDLFAGLARLLLAHGMHYASVEEALKVAMVRAARDAAMRAQPGALPHRLVSKVSASTGINRREVTRLMQDAGHEERQKPSPSLRVLARWMTDPAFHGADGPLVLARQGAAPSFEALAASVTRDIHPRSLLDDLIRLKAVALDAAADTVAVVQDSFVPQGDQLRMLGYLRDNVGDHLNAAVQNVLGEGPHLEQAIIATGLSDQSLAELNALARAQWFHLRDSLVPAIQSRIDADEAAGREASARLRIGLYAFSDGARSAPPGSEEPTS
jgi:Family of unknown function (DUF6502)